MTSRATTDLDRVEDIAAQALAAGRRAAAGLRTLPVYSGRRTVTLDWMRSVLMTGKLLDEGALDALADLEHELHGLVEAESWMSLGDYDGDVDLAYCAPSPMRCLTEEGRRVEDVREDLAAAIDGARHALDLLRAERAVGRARGFTG